MTCWAIKQNQLLYSLNKFAELITYVYFYFLFFICIRKVILKNKLNKISRMHFLLLTTQYYFLTNKKNYPESLFFQHKI